MRETALICLAAFFLTAAGVRAQSLQGPDGPQSVTDATFHGISSQLLRPRSVTEALSHARIPTSDSWQDPATQATVTKKSHAGRTGALIGLAAGTAAAALYWTNSNCRYGSDSVNAVVTHCIAPSALMIGGGWYIGRAIGRSRERSGP